MKWCIANGQRIRVIDHIWLDNLPISKWLILADTNGLEDKYILDFLLADGRWNIPELQCLFVESVIHRILDVHIHIIEVEDEPKLIEMLIGTSVTALAYEALFLNGSLNLKWLDYLKLHPRE